VVPSCQKQSLQRQAKSPTEAKSATQRCNWHNHPLVAQVRIVPILGQECRFGMKATIFTEQIHHKNHINVYSVIDAALRRVSCGSLSTEI
jgi:hypothetical protein